MALYRGGKGAIPIARVRPLFCVARPERLAVGVVNCGKCLLAIPTPFVPPSVPHPSVKELGDLQSRFDFLELSRFWCSLVVFIQRVAARGEAISRCSRAIRKSPADQFAFAFPQLNRIHQLLWIGQHHASQSNKIDRSRSNLMLTHIRQKLLQIRIARTDHQRTWVLCFQLASGVQLPRNGNQWILVGLVAVRRRIGGWSQ